MADDIALDEHGLEVIPEDECRELLASVPVGRLGFVHDRRPMILPVNFALDEDRIVVKTTTGSKLDAAVRKPGADVAFEIDAYDADARTGWSVLVQGTLDAVLDRAKVAELDHLALYPYADAVDRRRWIQITPTTISGRRLVHGRP